MADDHPQAARIEDLASKKLNLKLGVRKELRKLTDLLGEDEEVLNLARGQDDGKTGLLVITDRRIVFTEQGMMRSRLEDFPYEKVSSVQTSTAMLSGQLTIFVSGNKAEIKDVMPKDRVKEIGDYVRRRIGGGGSSQAPIATPASAESIGPSPIEQLKQLGELRERWHRHA